VLRVVFFWIGDALHSNNGGNNTMKRTKRKPVLAQRVDLPAAALKMKPAARYLGGLSIPTMHRLIKRGELVPVRRTRVLLFPITELDRFLKT
jgi:hypothetical protein